MLKKVEMLANVAVIITSVVLCSVLVKKSFFTASQTVTKATTPRSSLFDNASSKSALQPGTKVSLAGIDWNKNRRTILLVLSTTCHFCTESAPFYQKLQQRKPGNLQIVAVLPQAIEDSRKYLNRLGVSVSEMVQAPLASVSVTGTPTLMLIDSNGIIKHSWVGKLSDGQTEEVLALIAESN